MRHNTKLLLLGLFASLVSISHAPAQWAVHDAALLAQTVVNTGIADKQRINLGAICDSSREIERRIGDAGRSGPVAGAANVVQGLTVSGAAIGSEEAGTSSGMLAVNKLYRIVGESIVAPDGSTVKRNVDSYRKFNAAHQTAATYQAVLKETEARRQAVLDGIKATTEAVQQAPDLATVQKLQAVASAQIAALNAIDGERSAALGSVLTQALDNNTDDAKQEQARREDRSVDFHSAARQFAQFLTPLGSHLTSASTAANRR